MKRHNDALIKKFDNSLADFEENNHPLPGIRNSKSRTVFIKQLIDSCRRVEYVSRIANKPIDPKRAVPDENIFDPIYAALFHLKHNDIDEACWLIFLFVHFGKHTKSEWRYLKEVYGKLNESPFWTWAEITNNPLDFVDWLRENQDFISRGKNRGFGNHRKYQSLDADKPNGTGAAIQTYIQWVCSYGGHKKLMSHALSQCQNDPFQAFDWLYSELSKVASFGRTAKFDFLTMLGKVKAVNISPGSAYLSGATGPLVGSRLLLQGSAAKEKSIKELDTLLVQLSIVLEVGMQEIEDSLCNWQKSINKYIYFSG